jgi:two-component system, cell cycle sensor histidine kinase and response regulator CckA
MSNPVTVPEELGHGALLAAIVETAGSVILGLRPDHRIFVWNRAAEELYQTPRTEALGLDYVESFIAPEHRAFVAADIQEVLAGKRTLNFEDDSILPDGQRRTLIWNVSRVLDAGGAPIGIVAIGQDITERKEVEERFRLVFEHAQDGLLILDDSGVLDCNPAVVSMLGLTDKSQLIGHRPVDFSPSTQPDGQASDVKSHALGAQTLSQGAGIFDWLHQRPDGTPVPVEVSVRHAKLGGLPVSVVAWRDQTRRLELERERAAIQERLDNAHKMEAVGQLAGGIAHDFNNLLAAIRNAVQLATDALPPHGEVQGDLRIAIEAAERAAGLTRQLLAFSRQQPRATEKVCLVELVQGMFPLLRTSIPTSITLELTASTATAFVRADRSQLEQVVLNLVLNARDAMPQGGALRVTVGVDEARQSSVLSVSDTGTGMDDATRQRIFEPFFTTKPTGTGTGLGLAVVYGVVTQAGGTIDVESVLGRGTVMRVALPLASGDDAVKPVRVPTQDSAPHSILVVDDDDAVRSTTRRLLERHGWRVVEAVNGEDALRRFEEHREHLRIVLTDVRMPILGGVELARRLRAVAPTMPVVFFSGYDELAANEVRELFDVPLVAKPFAASELMTVLRQSIESRG